MRSFSTKELERLSGIKAHTIRIWEHRYKLFEPLRSESNTRLYTLDELQRLMNISLLVSKGSRISQVAGYTPLQIEQKMQALTAEEARLRMAVHHLIIYRYTCDIEKFEDVLDGCVHYWGNDTTIEKVIIPFLERVELFSYTDKSCETHFVVTAIRRKIVMGIEEAKSFSVTQKSALLFLAEGEHYDLMLLYIAYALKRSGIRVLYLGTNIHLENLKQVTLVKKPNFLYTYIPRKQKFKLHDLIPYLAHQLPEAHFYVATSETAVVQQNTGNVKFISVKEVGAAINEHVNRLPV